jgi:hypothetical protein
MTDDANHERHIASHIFNLVVMVLGGFGLAWMLREVGVSYLGDAIESVGVWFFLILALDLLTVCLDAAALHAFMKPEARMVSYVRVLAAQASGRAINVLTPTGALGEPTKLAMLVSHAPRNRVLSSLVLQNLAYLYLTVIVMVLGAPIFFLLVDVPHDVKVMVGIGFGVLIALMIALAVIIRRGAVTTIVDLVRGTRAISADRAKRWRERMIQVDSHIRELHHNRSHGHWKGLLWIGASKLVYWTSTIVLLHTAGVDVGPTLVLGLLSVGVLIQWIANFVPMGLGVADGGNYALFDLVSQAGPHGVVITMLNRARSISVAILGLGAMAAMHAYNRWTLARMHRRLRELRAQQQT